MHVVLLSVAYPPEVRSASLLTYDFAAELAERGHHVSVVTVAPRYNLAEGDRTRRYPRVSVEGGVRVVRTSTPPIHRVKPWIRGIGEMVVPATFAAAALRSVPRADVVEVYSPPLTLGLAGMALATAWRCPFVLNVQDLFPQNAVDLGLIRLGLVLKGLQALERTIYRRADAITVHSSGNRDFLVAHRGQPPNKVRIIPNWVAPEDFIACRTGEFRDRYGLNGDFVAVFAGVLGPAQGLDVLVDAAHELADIPDLKLLLVGDGTEKGRLVERCFRRNQRNVVFRDFVGKKEYPGLLADCDVGLVSITSDYRTPVVPGKLLGYMAAGLPVIAALNRESDGHTVVAEAGAGYSVSSADVAAVAAALRALHGSRSAAREMGRRGREYVATNFGRARCVAMYDDLFTELSAPNADDQRGL